MYFKKKKNLSKNLGYLNFKYIYKASLINLAENEINLVSYNDSYKKLTLINKDNLKINKKKTKNIYSCLEVIDFLYFFFNKNFYFFYKKNFLDYKFYNFFYKIMIFQKQYRVFGKFSSIFLLYFALFFFYKKPSLFMEGVHKLYDDLTRDEQISMHNILFKIQKNLPKQMFIENNIIGMQIKLKGQFCRRAGERRQTKYYRFHKFSTSNPLSKYIISHIQLNN